MTRPQERRERQAKGWAWLMDEAAGKILEEVQRGRRVDHRAANAIMSATLGEDTWGGKDRAEAVERAQVAAILAWGPQMLQAGEKKAEQAVEVLEGYFPSHTVRDGETEQAQQFSTPLGVAWAMAALAEQPRDGETVLEPSAGTGLLVACLKARGWAGGQIWANELADRRHALLERTLDAERVTRGDAARWYAEHPERKVELVVMNPPFSRQAGKAGKALGAAPDHVEAACMSLRPGGRCVVLTGEATRWSGEGLSTAMKARGHPARTWRVERSIALAGDLYAKRGTRFPTRLHVLEAREGPDGAQEAQALDTGKLGLWIARVGQRKPVPVEEPAAPKKTGGAPKARRTARKSTAGRAMQGPLVEEDGTPLERIEGEARAAPGKAEEERAYAAWSPSWIRFREAKRHPSDLVESHAMASVDVGEARVGICLPQAVVEEGRLSEAQLESVALAIESHEERFTMGVAVGRGGHRASPEALEAGSYTMREREWRRGWMLGDGTGTGKGRQIAGVIAHNVRCGRRKALWIAPSAKLIEDARRDWKALGGSAQDVWPVGEVPLAAEIGASDGIAFMTYATLRQSGGKAQRRTRMEQILKWLGGEDFEGVIVFDEAHAMANAGGSGEGWKGKGKASKQGLAGLELQAQCPMARVLYVSATGASRVEGLAYAERLGLWGGVDTPFTTRENFVEAMVRGGIAAMEVVARDLKSLGRYQARLLSFEGVEVKPLVHRITEDQRKVWDTYAKCYDVIHENVNRALRASGVTRAKPGREPDRVMNAHAKARALSALELSKQHFFSHLLSSFKVETVEGAIRTGLKEGRSAIVQIAHTGEAVLERRLAEVEVDSQDVRVDCTPREYVIGYLQQAFPVQAYERRYDEKGREYAVALVDGQGRPQLCEAAVEARDALLDEVLALPQIPGALDQLVWRLGAENVSEITGRGRRLERKGAGQEERYALEGRKGNAGLEEARRFMEGETRVLIFSLAGGEGRSYDADRDVPNHQRREHFLLEPGWRADKAVQGLGRSHRANQVVPPILRPVTTDVKGEKRFIATISRRLDSLGAITRGQRLAQSDLGEDGQRLYAEEDNLEGKYGHEGLRRLASDIVGDRVPGMDETRFERLTRLGLRKGGDGRTVEVPEMRRFLNRVLALRIADQDTLWEALEERVQQAIGEAKEKGEYELGVEHYRAEVIRTLRVEDVHGKQGTGAKRGRETRLRTLHTQTRRPVREIDDAEHMISEDRHAYAVRNAKSGNAGVVLPWMGRLDERGHLIQRVRIERAVGGETMDLWQLTYTGWEPSSTKDAGWREAWNAEGVRKRLREETIWLVEGLLLPVWSRLPGERWKVRRLVTDEGVPCIGRILGWREAMELSPKAAGDVDSAEAYRDLKRKGGGYRLSNGRMVEQVMRHGERRIRLTGVDEAMDRAKLRAFGLRDEVRSWAREWTVPNTEAWGRLLEEWPITGPLEKEAGDPYGVAANRTGRLN